MSKKDSKMEKELAEKKAYSKGRKEGIVFTVVALGFFAAGCISAALIMNKFHDTKETNSTANNSSIESTVDSPGSQTILKRNLVVGEARTEELNHVSGMINTLRDSNVAFIVETSDGYDGYMYNKYNECIQQNSDSSVSTLFTSDGHSVRVNASDGTIALDGSIDILTTCDNILTNALKGTDGYSVYNTETDTDKDGVTYSSCIVNIKGFDACKTLYENLGDEMAESAITKLKELVDTEYASMSNIESFDWIPEFEYVFIYSDNKQFGMQCNCIINGEAQNNWYADGYQETSEWKLTDAWKNVDWASNSTENFDAICEKLTNELELIDRALANNTTTTETETETETETTVCE